MRTAIAGLRIRRLRIGWLFGFGLVTLVALVALAPGAATAADPLDEARRAFHRDRYAEAISAARPALESPDSTHEREARQIIGAALVELGHFAEALQILRPLAGSARLEIDDASWVRLLARAMQGQGRYFAAADWWLTFSRLGPQAARESGTVLADLLSRRMVPSETAYLIWKYPRNTSLCPALPRYAEEEQRRGHGHESARAWALAAARCPGLVVPFQMGWAGDPAAALAEDFFTVGVLAPLNGPYARFGISLCNGADLARRTHNADARFPLRIEIADTAGDPGRCLAELARLYHAGVRVFIGEIFSLNTLMAASYLQERNAVLISPAATDTTLRHLGAGTYACTMAPTDQLRTVVEYAADSLGVRRLALLWPDDPASAERVRIFRRQAVQRGMTIVLERAYRPGTTDFSEMVAATLADSIISFDAMFCPGGEREMVALLSHWAHGGFLGPFLGTAPLGEEIVRQVTAEYGLLTLFAGEAYAPVPGRGELDFAQRHRLLYNSEPDDFTRRGWLAFDLVGRAVEAGAYCPEALTVQLEEAVRPRRRGGRGRWLPVPAAQAVPILYLQAGEEEQVIRPRGAAEWSEWEPNGAPENGTERRR
ncbi:MAG: amino acid ABC transporter substrate-binding protein [Candidatus Eisenbacteria sp.]|nr:amino acid ABC transporter substrate-binding protein [Candidatus Eisenbacteria bacterium]